MILIARNNLALLVGVLIFSEIVYASGQNPVIARVNLEAFSVEAPNGTDWVKKVEPNRVAYGRSLGAKLHTYSLEVREFPPAPMPVRSISEVLDGVRNAANKEAKSKGRYELISHTEAITNRLDIECVEYAKVWKDNGGVPAQHQELIMVAHALICVHPKLGNQLIEISYSYRNDTGEISQEAKREGEAFINSLQVRTSDLNLNP